ncbi:hypothetical protein St703_18800 [Sporolactobacillus terrae]|uniref:Uncharacterized protein n=1 Tax=Sporolactobacillus terrae TaxID=269673 RepID=A0A5K7WX52_9BACL|nr:hypothetical protein St703_18800 [Sporolactobacillus terrae]
MNVSQYCNHIIYKWGDLICLYGTYKWVKVINTDQMHHIVKVDACIASEIKFLNDMGVVTLSCCCGHGKRNSHVLISIRSVKVAERLGYNCKMYYYGDGSCHGTYLMDLKTGCKNKKECKEWHRRHGLPCKEYLDVISI